MTTNKKSVAFLCDVDPEYECVLIRLRKPTMMKAQKVTLIYDAVTVEGFSMDTTGKETPNGIRVDIPTKLVGIEWKRLGLERPKRK